MSFGQISLGSVFQGKSWDKGPSSLTLPRMVHHQCPVAPDMIWHIYSHLYYSLWDGGRDLPSSEEAAPTMGQVHSEFWADEPNFIFQPAAPDIIWHIYSHLYYLLWDGGRDLQSSGEAAPTMRQVPCEFQADQPEFSFSGEELRQGSFQHCPAQDCASSMAGLQLWFGTFTHTCTAPRGMVVGTCPLQGRQLLQWGRSPVSFKQIGQPSFFSQQPLMWFGTFTLGSTASRGF